MRIFFGWWQVAVALILNAASSASIFTAYSVIAVPLEQTFEPSRTMLMMGVTVANLAAGALSPFAGAAIDRFSVRLLMFGGTVILGAGFALLSFTNSMSQVILVYLFLAVAAVLAGPMAAAALLARWFTRSRGLAMSLAASGGALGGLIIPPLLQFLIDTFEWRMALQIYGVALFLVTGPLVGLVITNRPSDRNVHPDGDREPPPAPAGGDHRKAGSILVFLRNRNFWLIALCLGMLFSGPVGLLSNLVPFALEKGITASQGALLLSIFSAANFAGKLLSGPIADRVDYRLLLGSLMLLISMCFFGFVQSATFQLLALVTVVIGACQGAIVPLWTIILARVYGPDNMGRSMGLMSVVIMPFTLVAAPFFGWSYDATGSYNTALITYMLVLLATLAIVAMLRGDRPASVATAN